MEFNDRRASPQVGSLGRIQGTVDRATPMGGSYFQHDQLVRLVGHDPQLNMHIVRDASNPKAYNRWVHPHEVRWGRP